MAVMVNPYDRVRPVVGPPSRAALLGLFGLWAVTGVAGLVTLLGILTIGIYVAPLALALLVLSLWLTFRGPDRWPALAGLGFALGLGVAWLGVIVGRSSPASASGWCAPSADGSEHCVAVGPEGPFDPYAFDWPAAAPWLVVGAVLGTLAVVSFVALARALRSHTDVAVPVR